jgi:FeS assembly protein IscX
MKRTWQDIDALARDLSERYPGNNPLSVSLRELRALVVALPTFGDTPEAADNQTLEAIQAAWYEVCEE